MSDAALQVRKAILDKLKATGAVTALVASNRIYTNPPKSAVKPYITVGPLRARPDKADTYDGSITDIQIDVWTAGPEETTAMKISQAVLAAIDEVDLTLVDNQRLVEIKHDETGTQYLEEEGGLTIHAAIPFVASTEPSA